jgi:uncharacterized protein
MPKRNIAIDNINVNLLSNKIDPHTGFLHVNVTLCRSGIQEYVGRELGLTGNDAGKFFNVLRPPDEVTKQDSLDTYKNLVVTDEHPNERWVDLDNVKFLQRGQVSNINIDNSQEEVHLKGSMVITDQGLIEKAQNGKVEVSLGYAFKLVAEDGVYNGVPYQFKYTEMVANHLSVVSKGRCGSSCSITNDKKHDIIVDEIKKQQGVPVKVKINGKEFDVSDEVGAAIMAERKASTDMEADMEKEKEEAHKSNDALQAKVDTLEGKLSKANDSQMSDSDLNQMVTDRANLVAFARGVIGNDEMPDTTCPMAIKTAVVEKHFNISVDGKSDAYIDARYDMVQEDQVAADASVKKLANDMQKDKDEKKIGNDKIATDARDAYMKKKGM